MKKYIFPLLASLVVYLLGSFVAADFNISHWELFGRGITAWGMAGAAVFTYVFIEI